MFNFLIRRFWILWAGMVVMGRAEVSAPVFSPATGGTAVSIPVHVTADSGVVVHYTTNGADPTEQDPIVPVDGVIIMQKSATLKARAWLNGELSPVVTGEFEITGGMSAGAIHALAVKSNQSVFSWGQQQYGRLGNGGLTAANLSTPALLKKEADRAFLGAAEVSAGYEHGLILDATGQVWGMGLNTSGQLGNNTVTTSAYPVRTVKSILAQDVLSACRQVSAGDTFSLALGENGQVYGWGSELNGKLGHGLASGTRRYASPVELAAGQALGGIEQVSAGANHGLARSAHASEATGGTGQVWAWGQNTSGQLGLGDSANKTRAVLIPGLSNIRDISAGLTHSAVLRMDAANPGRVFCFGEQRYGRLGNAFPGSDLAKDVTVPVMVVKEDGAPLEDIIEVSAGPRHTLARDRSGGVWSWGFNGDGELGIDSLDTKRFAVPVVAPAGQSGLLRDIVRISAGGIDGDGFSLALHRDGTLYAWGRNANGQLGLGGLTSVSRPTAIRSLKLTDQGGPTGTLSVSLPQQHEPVTAALNVVASDPDGAEDIRSIEYFLDGVSFGRLESPPWSLPVPNLAAGSHQVTATLTDQSGNTSASNIVVFQVVSSVKIEVTGTRLIEGEKGVILRISRGNAQPQPVPVQLAFGGSALSGEDYLSPSGVVEIPAGETQIEIPLQALEDTPLEAAETLTIGLKSSLNYHIEETAQTISLMIYDQFDRDGDGLTNDEEQALGTNPNLADTDGDGLSDWTERQTGTNPKRFDTDGDGYADSVDTAPLVSASLEDPDGAGLDPALEAGLIGRWDFEAAGPTGGLVSTPESVGIFDIGNTNVSWDGHDLIGHEVEGMPWACVHFRKAGAYAKLPAARFHARSIQTWAMWIRFPSGSLDQSTQKRSLFSLGKAPGSSTDPSGLPQIHAYFDGTTSQKTLKIETYWIGSNYPQKILANWPTPANLDDGEWHHLAISFGSGIYQLFLDGVRTQNTQTNAVTLNLVQTGYTPYVLMGRMRPIPVPGFETLNASVDRLRVYQRFLNVDSALALYNQDIDRDGLFDRTESKERMWRDRNQNGVREPAETYYPANPFEWVPPDADTDGDGASDRDEQQSGTSLVFTDSDGDLMPDGWELQYQLNPKSPSDANQDPDGDGLSNLDEYRYNTNPRLADTDGDGVTDGSEAKGPDGNLDTDDGSNPNDGSDGGKPLPPEQKLSILLGVGDQSASHSEDYVLNVFRIDPVTGEEKRLYTLRSGGFGKYKEETRSFKREETLTFQIDWQGSNLTYSSSSDGPDFDYTFKVIPQSGDPAIRLTPYFDPESGTTVPGLSLLGQHDDVTDFIVSTERMRAMVQEVKIDLAMDTNMNGSIESLPDGVTNLDLSPLKKAEDRELSKARPDYAVVIDVNNNNTDASNATSKTKDQADHANQVIDTQADLDEMTSSVRNKNGHAYGSLRIWANPVLDYGIRWRQGSSQLGMRLRILEPQGDQVVRVFSWHSINEDKNKPEVLLGPGCPISKELPVDEFFDQELFGQPNAAKWYRDLVVEGLTYGEVTLCLEVIELNNLAATPTVVASDRVKVLVNVDQFVRGAGDLSKESYALPLRGRNPHYAGIMDLETGGTAGETRAVRGRLIARVPSANSNGWRTQLSPMRGRKLRINSSELNFSSGQSLWVGLKQFNGTDLQWVQCGLRWYQDSEEKAERASLPFAYLEDGAKLGNLGGTYIRRLAAPDEGRQNDGGLVQQYVRALQGWESERIVLDFILYKLPVSKNQDGNDAIPSSWRVIFKDARPGKNVADTSNYITLKVGKPSPNVTDQTVLDAFEKAYLSQKLTLLDAKHETNLSVAFAPGMAGAEGGASNLKTASGLANGVTPNEAPAEANPVALWSWLDISWAWNDVAVPAAKVKFEVRSGERSGDLPVTGTAPHPHWRVQALPNGYKLWDTRSFGFGTPK